MQKITLILVLVLFVTCNIFADENKADDIEKIIKDGIKAFREGIVSDDEATRLKAFDCTILTEEELRILFGKDAELLIAKMNIPDDFKKKLTLKIKKEFSTKGKIESIELIDVRANDVSGRYEKIKKIIPENIPLYRAVIKYEKRSSGTSTFLVINNKFKFVRGFESIPEAIQQLKKEKQEK